MELSLRLKVFLVMNCPEGGLRDVSLLFNSNGRIVIGDLFNLWVLCYLEFRNCIDIDHGKRDN